MFPLVIGLEFVDIDILEPLPRTKVGNQFVNVVTNRYTELTRAILTTDTRTTLVVSISFNDWIICYGMPSAVLSDIGQEFIRNLFTFLCSCFGRAKLTATAFHSQTNCQMKRHDEMLTRRQGRCIAAQ